MMPPVHAAEASDLPFQDHLTFEEIHLNLMFLQYLLIIINSML